MPTLHFWLESKAMSLHDLNKIITKAAKAIYDNEKFVVGVLAVRARKVAEVHPTDTTVVAMYNFLSKRAESKPLITRAELKEVYHKLYSQNNKFAGAFSDELGESELPKPHVMQRDPGEGKDFAKEAYEKLADPILSNALIAAFDKTVSYQPYSAAMGKTAARTCLHELNRHVAPRKVDVVAGQPDLLICSAAYETPKGECSVLVPVELKDNQALLPTMFLTQAGFVDLTKENLVDHITSTAGKRFTVDVQKLLETVSLAKNGGAKPLSELEMIIAKAKLSKGESGINGILYQEVDKPQLDVVVERLPEADTFEAKLASSAGVAEFTFGKSTVDAGRKMLKQAMSGLGFSHANIGVQNVDKDTIFFAVSADNKGAFKVPVKVSEGRVQLPNFIMASGGIYDFSKQGISTLLAEKETDGQLMAVASPVYGLKSNELIEQVKTAMAEGNIPRAEDALTVLQQSNDKSAYKTAFAMYMDGLNGKGSERSETECNMQRKTAHSKHVICGHTNLPVHKVYQDKNGDCHPLYRKHIAEAESASFMHSKVYFG